MMHRARWRPRPQPGKMNALEARYGLWLEAEKREGRIHWYKFEGIKLRLADSTFYTPDYFVVNAAGELEAHECKGHWEDDARVKIKVAASLYPFRFIAIKPSLKGWEVEEF